MRLYNLGKVPWHESQLIYHALAELGREALSLVSPATPYVCVGFHQDVSQELDVDYCRARGIPIFRRDLGGGAVYLDGDQLFFQVILKKDHPLVPKRKEAFYERFLQPVVDVYRHIGVEAVYKPVNDVIAGSRKISGTGVGEIGDCIVFVGNLIVDFDYDTMTRVLRVPDEKFRDKMHQSLKENLSTIRRELGPEMAAQWDEARLNTLMAGAFQALLGPLESCEKDPVLQAKIDEMGQAMMTDEWLYQKKRLRPGREIKIHSRARVVHRMRKAPGGLLRADFETKEGRLWNVSLSGDFFCYPEEGVGLLEARLEGCPEGDVDERVRQFYAEGQVETPGIEPWDWVNVLTGDP